MEYSGILRRFWAGLIDAIILGNAAYLIDFSNLFSVQSTILLQFVISILYFSAMESSKLQASCGMLILRIKITDEAGNRLTFLRAAGRELATLISTLTCGIGYLMIAFTKKKQALHDMIAETVVVRDQ